ncbi:MAG: aldo/keto reductase [Oligoflexia bacterium]|nr:aldo/keto reductase [Oligoflexia bacterium]
MIGIKCGIDNRVGFCMSISKSVQMPPLLYGTAWKKDLTCDLVIKAIEHGFQGIDTACQPRHYHEAGVGEALEFLRLKGIQREDLFIQTKYTPVAGQDLANLPYDRDSSLTEQVMTSIRVSLKNLKTSYVDALILHSPLSTHQETMEVWRVMELICAKGDAKTLGISNCYSLTALKSIAKEAKIKLSILQNRFYRESGHDKAIREWCQENGVVYQGFWILTANPQLVNHQETKQLAMFYKKSCEQIFYRFLTQIGIVPLIGTTSLVHMREDLAIFDFALTADDLKIMGNLLNEYKQSF